MDKGSITQELSGNPISLRTREDLPITMEAITIMEEFRITTTALGMEMGMEQVTIRTALTQQHPPRRI